MLANVIVQLFMFKDGTLFWMAVALEPTFKTVNQLQVKFTFPLKYLDIHI
jgi:hypothetical protein